MTEPILARMGVIPFCPKCGEAAMFIERRQADKTDVDKLVPVMCSVCSWEGVSRVTVPQPKIAVI